MAKTMTLHRNKVLSTTRGHVIRFRKDRPARVPESVVDQAMAIGATISEQDARELAAQHQERKVHEAPKGGERKQRVYAAVDQLWVRNDPDDFTAANKPKVGAVRDAAGFSVSRMEIDEALRERNRRKAQERLDAQQDDDAG